MKRRFIAAMLFICLVLSFTTPAFAADLPDTRSLAMINKPGVVLVQTVWTADVTWYEFNFYDYFIDEIGEEVLYMIEEGMIANTEESIYHAMIQMMIDYMSYYAFTTGNSYTEQMQTAAVGTGFIVTPDGYLITNAHVVHTDEEELYLSFAMSSLSDYAAQAADQMTEEFRRSGYEVSKEEWDGLANAFYSLLAQSMNIDNLQTTYQCFIGNVSPGSDVSAKAKGLDLRKMGEPIPGKDVAILKMEGSNLPTVTLGDDATLKTGDHVYAMGYPAVATLSDTLNIAQAIQEPTLTQGIVSARKEMAGGWNILQTDAAIHGGNSGGPLFNEEGEVVGVNTFGMIDASSGAQVAGMNFAIPVGIAKQFLNELNITPAESSFTTNYKKALRAYNSGDYHTALELLRGINETNPGFPVVQELLAEAREKADANPTAAPAPVESDIKAGPDAKPVDRPTPAQQDDQDLIAGLPPVVVYAGGAVLLIVIALLIFLLIRNRKKDVVSSVQTKPQPYASVPSAPASVPLTHEPPTDPAAPADVQSTTRHCSQCGAVLQDDSKFCADCGAPVRDDAKAGRCANCGKENPEGTKFCSECGTKLE